MNYPTLLIFLLLLSTFQSVLSANYEFTLRWLTPNTHTYVIEMETDIQTASYTDIRLASWRPGRYIMQDYAGAVSNVTAQTSDGQSLRFRKTNKDTWRIMHGQVEKIKVTYHFLADNMDAGSSYYGEGQVYFNPINLFMYVPGRMDDPVTLRVPDLPSNWKIATALGRSGQQNEFTAASFHEFADSPTVFSSQMNQLKFEQDGVDFYLHFQGAYGGDEAVDNMALENVAKICAEQAAIFGGYPFEEYHFIYRLLPYNMRHAVEHTNSASFALPASITDSPQKIKGLNGITSHEFWHAWNVKRIRPAALWPYNYDAPQYTTLHWFTEGVTDYYTNLTLVRAGLIDRERFFSQTARTIQSIENSYPASVVSPSESSFDSWLATSPYKDKNLSISYYTLGSRMGLVLDLSLRGKTEGKVSLDDVFVYLFENYYQKGEGVPEDGIQQAMEKLSGLSWQEFFDKYVHDTQPVDYKALFGPFGLELEEETREDPGQRGLGIIRVEKISQGLLVDRINPGGDAYQAGLGVNDLILEVDGKNAGDLDLSAYVNGLKKGDIIRMKTLVDFQTVKEIEIKYQGQFAPRTFELKQKRKLKNKEENLLDAWLESKVK